MDTRRSIHGLVGTWIAYWFVAGTIKLGPAVLAFARVTRGPDGHGAVNAGYNDGRFTLSVVDQGVTTYSGSVTPLALAAWIAGPPLLSWLAWAMLRRKREPVSS